MAWKIEFARGVERDLRRLSTSDQKRILNFLTERVAGNADPRAAAKRLHGPEYEGVWRYRVGDHRIFVEFYDARMVVMVVQVKHRSDAYR